MENTMTRADKIAAVQGKVVETSRYWNDSMGFYADSAIIWNPDMEKAESVPVGIDFWDSVSFDSVKASECIVKLYYEWKNGFTDMAKRDEDKRFQRELSDIGFPRRDQFEFIAGESKNRRDAMMKLLKSNLRSNFRKSLRDQLVKWLELTPENRVYNSPFSPKQWNCLAENESFAKRGWSRYR